jgi:hypothetical protein
MPGGLPTGLEVANAQSGANTAGSNGKQLTVSAANTKGSFVSMITSLAADCCWMVVDIVYFNFNTGGVNCAVDVAVGPTSGAAIVIAPNLVASPNMGAGSIQRLSYSFPIQIPASSQIWARAQTRTGSAANDNIFVNVQTFDGAFTQMEGCAGVDAIGFNTATTLGTAVAPSATTNTKGSFVSLVASAARDYQGFMLGFDNQGSTTTGIFPTWLGDIARGPSGSQQVILPNFGFQSQDTHTMMPGNYPYIPLPIKAGDAVWARTQWALNQNTPGITLYGVYK